jgi:hypothetical protein
MTQPQPDPQPSPALLERMQEAVDRIAALQVQWWLAVSLGLEQPGCPVSDWRDAAYDVIDAQVEMLEESLDRVQRAQAAGGQADEDLLRAWTDAQRGMWVGSLGASSGDLPAGGGSPDASGARFIAELESAAERLIDEQAAWARAYTAKDLA